jgi:hypothetical protein
MDEIMLGSALYYPHIDIDDPAWLRSALLFWDNIYTIKSRADPLQERRHSNLRQGGATSATLLR